MSTQEAPHRRTDQNLASAADALMKSTLYGGREPAQRHLDRLASVSPASARAHTPGERACILAARGLCLARVDDYDEAIAAAEFVSRIGVEDADLSDEERLFCFSSAVEIYVLSGDAVSALEWALRLEEEAYEAGDARWRYRARAALAAAHALHGMHQKARDCLAEMDEIKRVAGWAPSADDSLSLAAEAVMAFSDVSLSHAKDLAARARAALPHRPSIRALADLLDALSAMLDADLHTAAAFASCASQGLSQPRGSALVRKFGVLLSAVIQLVSQEPARALVYLEGIEPSPQHAICPGGLRAAAYLHQGDHLAALSATSECMRICGEHNLWTLPLSLMARAMASFALDRRDVAARLAADALAYARLNNLAGGLRMFPKRCVDDVLAVVEQEMPQFHDDIARYRLLRDSTGPHAVSAIGHPGLSLLSKRERVVAAFLAGNLTLSQVAQELHVSTGTIKAQTSSIYRKLGVRRRSDAALLLVSLNVGPDFSSRV